MADRIYIRAWKKEDGTSLADREIATVRSAKTLCVGTANGYIEFVSKDYIDEALAKLSARIDTLSNPSE